MAASNCNKEHCSQPVHALSGNCSFDVLRIERGKDLQCYAFGLKRVVFLHSAVAIFKSLDHAEVESTIQEASFLDQPSFSVSPLCPYAVACLHLPFELLRTQRTSWSSQMALEVVRPPNGPDRNSCSCTESWNQSVVNRKRRWFLIDFAAFDLIWPPYDTLQFRVKSGSSVGMGSLRLSPTFRLFYHFSPAVRWSEVSSLPVHLHQRFELIDNRLT